MLGSVVKRLRGKSMIKIYGEDETWVSVSDSLFLRALLLPRCPTTY